MIHWLVQSCANHPNLETGKPPVGLLNEVEQTKWASLKTKKRRCDWLLGRWTAKHLLQKMLQEAGEAATFDVMSVVNGRNGDPRVLLHGERDLSLSISHSHGHAFCAAVTRTGWPLGADIELIEPRSWEFVASYFTEPEMERVRKSPLPTRDCLVTAVWSAKESVLKAIRLGLTVDTRSVTCFIDPVAAPPTEWTPYAIQCDEARLPRKAPALTGWWRTQGEFVLTLATQTEAS